LDRATIAIARVNLRDLARKVEEAAVVLEAAGHQAVSDELMKVSERLTEIRLALERVNGTR
jgi:predicted dinucleotide-utilizing enzyme